MTQKIAVLIVHGAGRPPENFADEMIDALNKAFYKKVPIQEHLVFEPVFWSTVFESKEQELWCRLQNDHSLDYPALRYFVIQLLGDGVAYQPTSVKNDNYDKVHDIFTHSLSSLASKAGPRAPLCVIGHSLGSVIANNYFYDLQNKHYFNHYGKNTPMENGETLTQFYTLGSPLALWCLRYNDFGTAVRIPSPYLVNHYPRLNGEWINFFDKDDILAFPLKSLNEEYKASVTKDVQVNVGCLLKSWNPLSHTQYMTDKAVIQRIVNGLSRTWYTMNG